MHRILFVVFILISVCAIAQSAVDSTAGIKNPRKTVICGYPGLLPEFVYPSGFFGYMKANTHYPAEEKKNGIQGTVYISFVIDTDGTVTNVKERKGVTGGPGLTIEAIRVISGMPNWKPGIEDGKAVRYEMTQPVRFVLTENTETKQENIISYGPQLREDSLGFIFDYPEHKAECQVPWNEYINKTIPADQKSACGPIQIYISFIVLENGKLVNVQMKKGNENCITLKQSVLKAVYEMPNWKPGSFKTNPVVSRVSMEVGID